MADRPLVWLHSEVKSPPLSPNARIEAGMLLRRLQRGERLGMPRSRPMPAIGARCHELRISDGACAWRVLYRTDPGAILILDVFQKTTPATPHRIILLCRDRLERYDRKRTTP